MHCHYLRPYTARTVDYENAPSILVNKRVYFMQKIKFLWGGNRTSPYPLLDATNGLSIRNEMAMRPVDCIR